MDTQRRTHLEASTHSTDCRNVVAVRPRPRLTTESPQQQRMKQTVNTCRSPSHQQPIPKTGGSSKRSCPAQHTLNDRQAGRTEGRKEGKRRRPATGDTQAVAMTGALTARLFLIGTPSPPLLGGQVCGDGVCVCCVNGAAWFSPSQV